MSPFRALSYHLPEVPQGWALLYAGLGAWLVLFLAYWVLGILEVAARGAASAIGGGF